MDQQPPRRGRSAPSPLLAVMESRALFELGAVFAASPLLRLIGRGDEHPVLVLPGFMGGDPSTGPLRGVLRAQGYWAHGWTLGRNLGPTTEIVEGMAARLSMLAERHDRSVSLVGWSLGGIYARQLARAMPDRVRQVITLGSPFRMSEADRSRASALYDRLKPMHDPDRVAFGPESDRPPLTVPATSIYTRTDGIVRWWQCLESDGPRRENIEVRGSHTGLGFNPAAIYAISDRLAQPPDDWRPFQAPLGFRRSFPRPSTWNEHATRSVA